MKEEEEEYEYLYEWVDKIPLSKRTGNISRDFSDGVLMAELLKYYYPRHVDLHNYSPASSKVLKTSNWTTLNRKVFNKIGLQISNSMIESLVTSTVGAIQEVLENVRAKIVEGERANSINEDDLPMEHSSSNTSTLPVRNLNGEKINSEKLIPLKIVEEKNKQLAEKNEKINILSQKILHLERLVKLKNERITELSMQVQRYQV